MVQLSLQHRVKLGRQATLLNETDNHGPHTGLLGFSAAIAVLNVLFLVAGAVMTCIVDYSWYKNSDFDGDYYRDKGIDTQKIKLFFFYCTIPLVLSALSIYVMLRHRCTSTLRLAIGSGVLGLLLWTVQVALQGKCMFVDLDFIFVQPSPGFCGFSLRESWRAESTWQSGLGVVTAMTWVSLLMLVLYIAYITLAVVLLFKQRRTAASSASRMPQAYAYHSAVEETEMQTDRDMPDRSTAPTPVPEHADGRPPSYRSASAFHEDSPPEKEREMV